MPRKETFRIEGLRELDTALRELPRSTRKNLIRRGMVEAAQPVAKDASRRARRRSGALANAFLRGVGTKLSRRQRKLHPKKSAVEVYIGPGTLPQAITEEFGTANQAPHPSLRPAWDANRMSVLASLKQFWSNQIEAARARLARKAARLAAKR